jgi:hypothetical protein
VQRNNPNYDDKKLTYGFLMALHTSNYQVEYADQFITQQFDTVHSVNPMWSSGFSLGFIVNYRLSEFLDLRLSKKYEDGWFFGWTEVRVNAAGASFTVHELGGRRNDLDQWGLSGLRQ